MSEVAHNRRYHAPAKINLWLRIFAPDQTGYHPLDTVFCALELADVLTFENIDDGIDVVVRNADVGPTERNLAYRAALEFYQNTGLKPGIRITLDKNIPAGAGLGGGSSDAATVLRVLNELHDGVVSNDDLLAMAALLGSDVPFFLCGSSLAHATGRGEMLQALPPLPRAPLLVVTPEFGVSTPAAYRWLDEARAFRTEVTEFSAPMDWNDVVGQATNDFERVLFARHPELQQLRDQLLESGARLAMVSGSGSALFGLYATEAQRDRAQQKLPRAVATNTLA